MARTRYRRRFDIIADIINVARSGAKKTKIMYFANLSYLLLEKYLDDAVQAGFLRLAGDEYEVTRKGEAYLQRYEYFHNKYSRLQQDFEELRFEADALERMCRPRQSGERLRRSRLATLR